VSGGLLDWWLLHPKEWHASPFAGAGLVPASIIVIAILWLGFRIKGRFWP
jgi:hypothetical protein